MSCNRNITNSSFHKNTDNNFHRYNGIYTVKDSGRKLCRLHDTSLFYYFDTLPDISFNAVDKIKMTRSKYDKRKCLEILLNDSASHVLKELTRDNHKSPLPIIYNNQILTAPIVVQEIEGDVW